MKNAARRSAATLHKADFDSIRLESHDLSGQVFSCGRFEHLKLPLLGEHQLHNAAVVLAAVDALKAKGWNLTDEAVRTGLETVQWPGRFQLMREKPLFIVDGGHNPQCIEALVQNIDDYLKGRELTILTGVLGDKDFHCMYKTSPRMPRSSSPSRPPIPAQCRRKVLPITCASSESPSRLAMWSKTV